MVERLLYISSSGDRWSLVHDVAAERVFVRHEPNAASGGLATELEIGEFLIRGVYGPEHQELLRLIGTLVDSPRQADADLLPPTSAAAVDP